MTAGSGRGARGSEDCYAAALAALPGMGPAMLCRILAEATPSQAWAAVCSGVILRPEGRGGAGSVGAGQLALGDDGAGLSLVSTPDPSARLSLISMPDPGVGAGTAGGWTAGGAAAGDAAAAGAAAGRAAGSAGGAVRGGRARQAKRKRPWLEVAAALDPPAWWEWYAGAGISVTWRGQPDYPLALVDDPQPPGVLFWRGSLAWLDQRRVAIIGTRSASSDGREIAFAMGRDLAAAGVCVISGLALGIDGACHAGVLDAVADAWADGSFPGGSGPGALGPAGWRPGASGPGGWRPGRAGCGGLVSGGSGVAGPVGVAASGVDVPYPRQHRQLWEQVALNGALLSETPPGRAAQAWMFPSRNRLIAGLAELVVVVESHRRGGSLITAEAAIDRGVEVRVVPGPVRSPASEGSNQLLCDGPGPVRDAADVLDVLGLGRGRADASQRRPSAAGQAGQGGGRRAELGAADRRRRRPGGAEQPLGSPPSLSAEEGAVLDAMPRRPVHLEQLMTATGLGLARVQRALDGLIAAGLVEEQRGWWCRC